MKPNLQDYWNALDRLVNNKTINLPKGSLINKDSVALEAGRLRGSIKKSRESFAELIAAIEKASIEATNDDISLKFKISRVSEQKKYYRELYHQSLNRELMLLERVANLEKQLKRYGNIIPINID